jgi:hypothetical protein
MLPKSRASTASNSHRDTDLNGAAATGGARRIRLAALAVGLILFLAACQTRTVVVTQEVTHEVTREVQVTALVRPEEESTPKATAGPTGTPSSSKSEGQASPTPDEAPALVSGAGLTPYPDAPVCEEPGGQHDNSQFHTLWDSVRGCHYDHEHGENPFTPDVAAAFLGFDLRALLGGVGVGHTNPSSPMENTHKHGGFKWQVVLDHPHGCAGFEGSEIGVNASVIEYHAFGDYSIEFESRVHSALALLRQCRAENPTDYGYLFTVQHVDYGQRVVPYQGQVMAYPDSPSPAYDSGLGPYFTMDCVGTGGPCRDSLQTVLDRHLNANSIWTSDPKHLTGSGSSLFELLFRVRDTYQLLDWSVQAYPFKFAWLCSSDGGATYSPAGCYYNNSTTRVHEINGTIPAEWDNLDGFDTDARVGRITADGFVTRFGELNAACTAVGPDCHPIKLVQAFVGYYGSQLIESKTTQFDPASQPERDIFFCGNRVCAEGDAGAVPSGWIGPQN